jgi:hypothetical protein
VISIFAYEKKSCNYDEPRDFLKDPSQTIQDFQLRTITKHCKMGEYQLTHVDQCFLCSHRQTVLDSPATSHVHLMKKKEHLPFTHPNYR